MNRSEKCEYATDGFCFYDKYTVEFLDCYGFEPPMGCPMELKDDDEDDDE